MSLMAELERHAWWVNMLIGLFSISGLIVQILGFISRDILLYTIVILFIILIILNLFILRQRPKTTGLHEIESKSTKTEDEAKELEAKLAKAEKELESKETDLNNVKQKFEKLNQQYQNCIDSFTSFQRGRNDKHSDEVVTLKNEKTVLQKRLEDLTMKCQNDELEKLIKPLYLSLDSNRDNPLKGTNLAFEDIKRYGNFAQPELRNLLRQYCDIREEWEHTKPEDQAPTFHLNHQKNLCDTINQIDILVRKRYEELMWGEDES